MAFIFTQEKLFAMALFKNKYLWLGVFIYLLSIIYLHFTFEIPFTDFLPSLFILCIGFSAIAWWCTKDITPPAHHAAIKNEFWILLLLVGLIGLYITYGSGLINKLIPATWLTDPQSISIVVFVKKLFVFVLIPFAVYKALGFRIQDFGLTKNEIKFSDKRSLRVFIILSIAVLLFQFFLANGGRQLRKEHFSILQFIIAAPLCFIYLLFDAGLIEEFFFRGLLQSRLSVLLKSNTGSIIITALIFGLVHAPGLYLRGAEGEGVSEQMPFLFWSAYTIAYMSMAGIFLGVVYSKTKNLWLVMAIHAMVDLIPNLTDFIRTWHL